MTVDVKVPVVGESILEVQIAHWLKHEGQRVEKDEDLVEIESEKATVLVPSPSAGTLASIVKRDGEFANVGDVIGQLDEAAAKRPAGTETPIPAESPSTPTIPEKAVEEPVARPQAAHVQEPAHTGGAARIMPAGPERASEAEKTPAESKRVVEEPAAGDREEETVPMSMIRRAVAQRLVEAQHTAALLTTFNEVDMSEVIALRKKYGQRFQEQYGVKLGFLSFFVKAAIEGLKRFPQVNAAVRGRNIVYHKYYDIGVAIGGGKGLVVPVLRNAERMSFAQIERAIADMAARARDNRLLPEELEGGTFTISNGGVYGSMLSTPIVNPPQSGILGLHAIEDRPVAREGQVVIRPMMYLALSYDHRVIDGREAVGCLRTVKEIIEDPARLLLAI